MAADEDSRPVTELQPIAGIASRTRSAGATGRANPNPVATSNIFGENDDGSSNSFPSETSITMVAEQDERSPFDSSLTFVLHKMFGIDFTKEPTYDIVATLTANNVFTWYDFMDMTPKMILDIKDINDMWTEKLLGLQAFAVTHQDGDDELVIPNSVDYRRSILRKFMRSKDFTSSALDAIRSNKSSIIYSCTILPKITKIFIGV